MPLTTCVVTDSTRGHFCQKQLCVMQRRQLAEPVENPDGRTRVVHDKPPDLFCRSDQVCVCMPCPVLDHKPHKVLPPKEQFEEQKVELGRRDAKMQRIRSRR